MSLPDPKRQLYLHSNDSSLSTIQFQKIPTPVSSVGFNTLKKQTTSSSLSLSITTATTNKPNTLSKLFTRNRSSLTISEDALLLVSFDEKSKLSTEDEANNTSQRSAGLFKMSRKLRSKLKFSNKGVSRPDLTIQTAGHHTLKVPKKILSSANSDEFTNKKAVSSPISRNLFHRQHNQPRIDLLHLGDEETGSRQVHTNHHRTAINLSSQSSNSFISDITVAVLYNFTDPDYSVANLEENEGVIFLDFHKRYMTSADQFLQSKSHKSENASDEITLRESSLYTASDGRENETQKAFNMLYQLLKPLFLPSKQILLTSGVLSPQMQLTMEQAKSFVREKIVNSAMSLGTEKHLTNGNTIGDVQDTLRPANEDNYSIEGNLEEDIQDLRRKEVGQQLFYFFEKCCTTLVEDMQTVNDLDSIVSIESMKYHGGTQNTTKVDDRPNRIQNTDYNYIKEWKRIKILWQYFNMKVRFFMLNTFSHLQKHFNDEDRIGVNNGQPARNVQIENALFLAFRDIVVIPHLLLRPTESDRVSCTQQAAFVDEINFFRNEGKAMVKPLKHCFGTILSHLRSDLVGSDEQPFKELILEDYSQWFSEVTR